ncbi:hypothetical protein Golax_023249 [Gossypium laxum]|uniref:RNase H type-1 domain-containing protein n=1 Tax=Gossypium laxum TaxID=34288 RepID=A0A7J9B7R1_9ROSI|nr:hypothetical protein [Gossypium laxum]
MEKLPEQVVKINFDAAYDGRSSQLVVGIMARDSEGNVLLSCSKIHQRVVLAFAAKALTCRKSCRERYLRCAWFYYYRIRLQFDYLFIWFMVLGLLLFRGFVDLFENLLLLWMGVIDGFNALPDRNGESGYFVSVTLSSIGSFRHRVYPSRIRHGHCPRLVVAMVEVDKEDFVEFKLDWRLLGYLPT